MELLKAMSENRQSLKLSSGAISTKRLILLINPSQLIFEMKLFAKTEHF